ncbi:hypothetical protein PAXRUDRAFT_153943 [Paxillus rubicundulus Ve08.2h10]|uniref:Zn(2)-C6 fungal-type domain-containing protein n=1 Tax=Paxillus rubicundulus Ve08.2h10 TaxID=930991 RepID=A0A0D0DKS2_9AGAM|nr:hypothetical protein PAXRUDRAFT_153943 [Paxillus rubicundulus Ve08.2h10]
MSSADDDYNDGDNQSSTIHENKKRRVERACDMCRRKKSDGNQMPDNRCSNCLAYNVECTYVEAAKKRGPPKGYVESLENRLEKMEKLLQRVCPDADFTQELGGARIDRETWQRGSTSSSHIMNTQSTSPNSALANGDDLVPSDDEDIVTVSLSENLKNMNLNPSHTRFFGKSSGIMLIQKAIDLKKEYTGGEESRSDSFFKTRSHGERFPWEDVTRNIKETQYVFPDEDLGISLVNLYFVYMNCLTPLLHRPSFERKVIRGDHLHDSSFGAVYLLVCAVGSRFSDDPHVLLEGTDSEHSAGWKYFQQVQMVRKTLLGPPCLEDLQVYCLSVMFLQGTSAPQACWTMVGIGIRLAQDVGAHRRKAYSSKLSAEGELWKRAFWVLVTLDRQMSSSLGRPCAIQDEDFDLDFPVECDDEYWEDPNPDQAFEQPPDKPSTMSFFTSYLKLNHILAFALRTIYSINKSKVLLGFVGQQWEQHIVAELDSALNQWIDAVPEHLRWDPTGDVNPPFFMQSSALYSSYYLVQISIHRPFIPSPRKPSPLSFPSLAICTNAARSCSHVIDIYKQRSRVAAHFLQMPAFTAGIVLLLNIWGGKQSGLSTDPSKEMADVHKCMAVLKRCEKRWHTSGRLWDILCELATVGDLPLPQPSPTGGTKRDRESDSPPATDHFAPISLEGPRTIAGSRRNPRDVQSQPQSQFKSKSQSRPSRQQSQPRQLQGLSSPFNLPLYSNELGRLPLHGQVDFPTSFTAPTTASTSPQVNSTSMWYSSLPTGTHHLTDGHPPTSEPSRMHDYANPSVSAVYSMDESYYGQMTSSFESGYTSQHRSPDSVRFSGPGLGGSRGRSRNGKHGATLVDANVTGQPPLIAAQTQIGGQGHGPGHEYGAVDPDTIAMWSTAPTGFELNDWGTYIMNASATANADAGPTPQSRHGTYTTS